ncbi:MAG: transcriptional regulator [Actinophytocola sp.]|uniref:MmyB family transcriptional regulator n=1 Tax=Actinophytocola sp. TaxID=1872138 RepID=UPI0013215111|nr:transcriptional regulator [Actinophytocola sp.]MPZ82838.1 transcriptional regulator [Actinophytocola sp.]
MVPSLRLDNDERAYLFDLARQRPARSRSTADPAAARLVVDLSPLPAMLIDHRFDILAWNEEMAGLMLDFGALPVEQRNTMWLCLCHPAMREFYRERERVISEGIADLRAAWAARPDDESLVDLVGELTVHSPEFAALWERRDVRVNGRGRKRLHHPRVGPLAIDFEVLNPLGEPDQRLIIYRAADAASQTALDAISREAAEPHPTLRAL